MGERDCDRLPGKAEVMFYSRHALFLEREEDALRRADGNRGVVSEMDTQRERILHPQVSIWAVAEAAPVAGWLGC